MRKRWRVGLLAAVFVLASGALPGDEKPEAAAEAGARKWLALTDAGKYGESWDRAATPFHQALTRAQWEEALRGVRSPLGKLVSRKLASAKYTTSLPNAPAGEYVVLIYGTEFEKRSGSTETVTFMKDKDGSWKSAGYFIK